MRLTAIGLLLVPWLMTPAPGAPADGPSGDRKPSAVAVQYQAIIAEYGKAHREYSEAIGAARTAAQRRSALAARPRSQSFAARLLDLAKHHPEDPAALDAL